MPIEVTDRHESAPRSAVEYARSKAEELVEEFPRVEHAHVILDSQRHEYVAEVTVQGKNHIRVEASDQKPDVRAAIDGAFARTETQLRKRREKLVDHKAPMKHMESAREKMAGEETDGEEEV
ncbi:MAG: HPF/RaiA family ribosome-associated protein [Kiritimatiellia bacterium]